MTEDLTGAVIAYEQGDLDEQATVELFQRLIDTGLAWTLQGHYGRTAARLIRAGKCRRPSPTPPTTKDQP
jgi:hypothetical protein